MADFREFFVSCTYELQFFNIRGSVLYLLSHIDLQCKILMQPKLEYSAYLLGYIVDRLLFTQVCWDISINILILWFFWITPTVLCCRCSFLIILLYKTQNSGRIIKQLLMNCASRSRWTDYSTKIIKWFWKFLSTLSLNPPSSSYFFRDTVD